MDTDAPASKPSSETPPRSRSPRRLPSPTRRRSRSPPRRPRDTYSSGFRWKQHRRNDEDRDEDRRLNRGYRVQDKRDRSPWRERSPRRDRYDRGRDNGEGRGRDQRGEGRERTDRRDAGERRDRREKKDHKDKEATKVEKPAAPAPSGGAEPMIIVTVNDRLGTKAQIPCLASDPIKLFKAQVAARIGRQPHEIMLKRQGERPFKDQLTLEDYGVSNGVQLDL